MDTAAGKTALRTGLLAARRDRPAARRAAAQRAVEQHLRDIVEPGATLALFLPLPTEPLARETVRALADTHRVLLPVATRDRPLDWAWTSGGTRRGPFGIDEPAGPRLGPAAVHTADLVLVPALAVDRAGRRLGRGGGHYDRTLARIAAGPGRPRLVAVVFDDELLDEVPVEDTDRPVDAVLTPSGGVRSAAPHPADPAKAQTGP